MIASAAGITKQYRAIRASSAVEWRMLGERPRRHALTGAGPIGSVSRTAAMIKRAWFINSLSEGRACALRRIVMKKNGEGIERSLAAWIKTAIDFDYQTNRSPSCIFRLPPLNDLFFKNCALVTRA